MKFSELQVQLQEKFGIDRLADIARELEVSPQAVSNWKARDRVPYKYVLKIRKQLEESSIQGYQKEEKNTSESNQVSSEYSYPPSFQEDTISPIDLILVLARQFKIIIITPTILCVFTILYVLFIAESVYESSAKIMSSKGISSSQPSGLAAQFGFNLQSRQSEPEWVYPEIIKSRTLARSMLKRKFDTEKYGPKKTLLQILSNGADKKPAVDSDILIKSSVNSVIGMIDIQDRGSFFELTISGPEPVFVREFAIALIEELDKYQRNYNQTKTSKTRQFIEERIIDTRTDLENVEEALKDFTNSNRRIENSPALKLERERLAREVAVLIGVFTTLKQQLETTKIEEVKDSEYVVVLDPPEAPFFPTKPKKRVMVFYAGIVGLLLGTVIGFIKETTETRDHGEQEKIGQIRSLIIENITDFLPRRFKKN